MNVPGLGVRATQAAPCLKALVATALLAVAACGGVEEGGLAIELEPHGDRGSFGVLELTLAPEREHRLAISGIPPETGRLDVVFDLTGLKGALLALVEGAEGRDTPVRAVALPGRPVMVRMRPGAGTIRVTLVGRGAEKLPVRVLAAALRGPAEEPAGARQAPGGKGERRAPAADGKGSAGVGGGVDDDRPVDLLREEGPGTR